MGMNIQFKGYICESDLFVFNLYADLEQPGWAEVQSAKTFGCMEH